MKDRQQKGSQHVPLWQTIINGLCKVIPSALPLYLWLDVFFWMYQDFAQNDCSLKVWEEEEEFFRPLSHYCSPQLHLGIQDAKLCYRVQSQLHKINV